jgi:hypothetical protein
VHTNNQSGSFSLREKDTSAGMREVEQRREQLPRMRAVFSEPSALTPALSRRERENTVRTI